MDMKQIRIEAKVLYNQAKETGNKIPFSKCIEQAKKDFREKFPLKPEPVFAVDGDTTTY